MTRWDWKSILGYLPLATGSYTPGLLRHRANIEGVKGTPYSQLLEELAKKVEDGSITPYEAQKFLHGQQRKWGVR